VIVRVEIVRLHPSASDNGMHIVLVTRTGGRAESLGPFGSLWEACSVAGDLDDAEPVGGSYRSDRSAGAEQRHASGCDYWSGESCSCRLERAVAAARRRRGDTEPITFDAAAAAAERLAGLKK